MKNIKHINEYFDSSVNDDDEMFEMANITQKTTGIKDVVIWIGPNPASHGKRVKVSNIPNSFEADCFTITIPELNVIGKVNTKFITSSVMNKIKKFITTNNDLISKYSDRKLSTEDLLVGLKKVT